MKLLLSLTLLLALPLSALTQKKPKRAPDNLVTTPFVPANPAEFPDGTDHLDIFLLMGQSNMKGRGVMPDTPLKDPRIIMLHKATDEWFHARHPLHHVGDPNTFEESDNAGVGPGLAFALALAAHDPAARIALIPCAVGGTQIAKWQKGERLYEEAVRRAKLALEQSPKGKTRIAGAIWLQGEADSATPEQIAAYPDKLEQMITALRADLNLPELPFIVCTIGELKEDSKDQRAQINDILLDLPNQVPNTAAVDSREYAADIGDSVHFDTATQNKHGQQFAEQYLKLTTTP
ncbi:MAG: sialate O-acetylesterase [Verrucomicrobiota bacterium]